MSDADSVPVQSTATSFAVLEALKELDGAGVSELATRLETSKSTVHRHVTTLERLGYVDSTERGYHLTHSFLGLAHAARKRLDSHRLVRERVESLAEETGERAQFVVRERGYCVCLYRASGERAVDTAPEVGSRMPLHATAAGKAILAASDEVGVDEVVREHGLEAVTPETVTAADDLREEVRQVGERGYATNRNEHIRNLTAFGVPVRGDDGVIGAISISGPSNRFDNPDTESRTVDLLRGTANELELNIVHAVD